MRYPAALRDRCPRDWLHLVPMARTSSDSPRRPLCVHVLPTTEAAGAETVARELLRGLAGDGRFDLELAYFLPGRAHLAFAELGIPLRQLKKRGRFRFDFPRLSWRLRRQYARREPDILHTWIMHGNVAGLLAARGWPKTRVIITQLGGRTEEIYHARPLRLQGALMKRADHAIANSSDGAALLRRLGMATDDVSLVLNGISAESVAVTRRRQDIRAELGLPDSAPVVAVVTRANDPWAFRVKNFTGLLDAMRGAHAKRPDLRLMLVGPTQEELLGFGLALPAWALATGFVPQSADYMAAADVVAVPSHSEGTSNTACEALMLGMPVATTAVGDHVPIVEEAGGRSVPTRDPSALAEAVLALLDDPPTPGHVQQVARRRLSFDDMVNSTVRIYESLLAADRSSAARNGDRKRASSRS